MKKIISTISDWWQKGLAWCKGIFAKREGQSNFKRGMIIGLAVAIVIIIVLALALWLSGVWSGKKEAAQPTAPVAEVKAIVLTSAHCGSKCWDTG